MAEEPKDKDAPQAGNQKLASYSTRPHRMPQISNMNMPKASMPRRFKFLLLAALVALLVGFGGGWLGAKTYNSSQPLGTSKAARQQYISNESNLISTIAKDVGQSVVSVDVESQVSGTDFFGFTHTQSQQSAGTGFIVSAGGIIVTNRHVVPDASDKVSVTLSDGTKYDNVQVIGRSNANSPLDVAFLKIGDLKGKTLVPVTLADSSKVQVGDKVIAIGNALGQFQNTVTSGIISGFGRDVAAGDQGSTSSENLTDLFQTDAAINEGNSGGPLVDINGEVIGVNTAVASGAQNIGFSIPINDVKGLINDVLSTGSFQQPFLGVRYVSLTNDLANQFNVDVTRGAYIVSGDGQSAIITDSPADKAGLKEKDIITKVDNTAIDDKTSLTAALSKHKVGDEITLKVTRNGKTITLHTTLTAAPSQ